MRGPHPQDRTLFREEALARMREAAADLRYLLGRGYATPSALGLVGDRFQLVTRQRQCLMRAVCAPADAQTVRRGAVDAAAVRNAQLCIDGHNVVITLETALAGGLLVRGDDGFVRDLAEKHGAYRKNVRTEPALRLLGAALSALAPARVCCYFDRPLSGSGALARRMREIVPASSEVEVVPSPDFVLKARAGEDPDAIIATSDSGILRRTRRTFDLSAHIITADVRDAWMVSL